MLITRDPHRPTRWTRRPAIERLYRALHSAERTSAAYVTLAGALSATRLAAPEGSPLREIAEREILRLEDLSDEHDADADDLRTQILEAGGTLDGYLHFLDTNTND